jgi:hypothetical protein
MSPLTPRELELLRESDAIDAINDIDYSSAASPEQGHAGALVDALERARAGNPLELGDVCRWQGLIAEERRRFGYPLRENGVGRLRSPEFPQGVQVGDRAAPDYRLVPRLAEEWIEGLHNDLATFSDPRTLEDSRIVELIADHFQSFDDIHPFAFCNGATGRLVVAYIATYCGEPPIIFRAAERECLFTSHRNRFAMRCLIADKMREVFQTRDGSILARSAQYDSADRYEGDGTSYVVERHALIAAQSEWQALA